MDTLPLLIGFLFFIACFIWGLVLLAVPFGGRTRKDSLFYLQLSLIGWLPILPFVPPIHPTLESVSGVYIEKYDGGRNIYHLNPDGTLLLTFEKNGHRSLRKRGTWEVSDGEVWFDNLGFANGSLYLLSSSIGLNEDAGIYLEKVEKGTLETVFPFVFWPLLGFYLYALVRRFRASRRIPQRVS